VSDGFHLTASADVLRRLLETPAEDMTGRRARLLLGYGWGRASSTRSSPHRRGSRRAGCDLVFETAPGSYVVSARFAVSVDPMRCRSAPACSSVAPRF